MKRQFLPGLALLTLLLIASTGFAQTKVPLNEPDRNRPRLFNKMPDELQVDLSDIDQLILPARSAARSESLMKGDKKCAALPFNIYPLPLYMKTRCTVWYFGYPIIRALR